MTDGNVLIKATVIVIKCRYWATHSLAVPDNDDEDDFAIPETCDWATGKDHTW